MYRFALIGCGRIAARHAENINRVGKLVAVCDIDQARAKVLAELYKVKAFTSITELLRAENGIDIVVICTPNGYHAEHCIQSLESGRDVLCEKPLCISTADAWKIIEAEKSSGRKLFVVKSMRFNPLLKDLKRLIDTGKLGKIYSFQLSCFWNRSEEYYNDWHGKKFPDGGTLFTQFSHYIDAMLWLFGNLEEVACFAKNAAHGDLLEFEDTGVASLKFEGGVLGSLNWSVNTFEKNFEIALVVIAEKGTIALGGEYLNEIKYQKLSSDYDIESSENNSNWRNFSHHLEVYNNIILALQDEDHSFTNAFDGMKTVEAIERLYKSTTYFNK